MKLNQYFKGIPLNKLEFSLNLYLKIQLN